MTLAVNFKYPKFKEDSKMSNNANNTNNANNLKRGICFVNCDEAYYQKSLKEAAKDCVPFAYDVILKEVYSQDVGIDENNPDIPKGIEYKFNHILVKSNKWIQPDIDEDDSVIDITYLTAYAEQYTVLIDKREMRTFAFQKFLRDRLIYNLSCLNRAKITTTPENVRMYRDMRTLINFCNKYRSLISVPKRNKPLDRTFNQRFILIHTEGVSYYSFAIAELPVNPIDDGTDSMSIFNSINYYDPSGKMTNNTLSATLEISTQEEALVRDNLSNISDKLGYFADKLKSGIYPFSIDVIINDIKNMGTELCTIINKYKNYSCDLGHNFYKTAYAMLHVLKVISYAVGKPVICEADNTVSFAIK